MLSSVIPIGTYSFEDESDKFYGPHDVSMYDNDTVCLIDDGTYRPIGNCNGDDDYKNCYSRALCYKLESGEDPKLKLKWQFEYPESEFDSDKESVTEDLYNQVGGSLRKWDDSGTWVAAFTRTMGPYNKSQLVFELTVDDESAKVSSLLRLPQDSLWVPFEAPHIYAQSGSYRASPISSIKGEYEV